LNSAVAEDALRAVESKNGVLLQGRKIKVELAKRRAPLDQRRPLTNVKENKKDVDQKDGVEETAVEPSTDHLEGKIQKKKRKAVDDNTVHSRVSAPEATPQDTKKLKPSKLE
jgi:RNA recognition motif-containing protein